MKRNLRRQKTLEMQDRCLFTTKGPIHGREAKVSVEHRQNVSLQSLILVNTTLFEKRAFL